MKVTCIQMDMQFCQPDENFAHAAELIEQAMAEKPDVLVLPETWNTGFFPREGLESYCDLNGQRVKQEIGGLAKRFAVNIVAGSVSNVRDGKIYNTAMVFDRQGSCIASYDKTHLFTPMGEDAFYTPGEQLCAFMLDGVSCGIAICYDLRFPELTRSLAVAGLDVLFVVSQWPAERINHLRCLTTARAIENQIFLICCNSCATAGETVYGGNSAIIDPLGRTLAVAEQKEQLLSGEMDLHALRSTRESIHVFRDRRPELYQL